MSLFQQTIEFWVIVAAAIAFKISTSERLRFLGVLATVTGSTLSAVAFTPLVVDFLDLTSASASYAIACLLALTGEDVMRRIIVKSREGESFGGILKWLRDGNKEDNNG